MVPTQRQRSTCIGLIALLWVQSARDWINSPLPRQLQPWGVGLVIIAVTWTAITMLYVVSNSCLQDHNSLACWVTNGSFAEFLHGTWLFGK